MKLRWLSKAWNWLRSVKDGKAGPEDVRFRDRYREFREFSLSVVDSFYNSLHICVHERLLRTKKTKTVDSFPICHPLGWEQREEQEVYSGFWLTAAKVLDAMPRVVSAPFAFLKKKLFSRQRKRDNTLRFFLDWMRRIRRHLPYLVPICLALFVFGHMYATASAPIAIGAAVEGKALGLVESMDQINDAIDEAEKKASNVLERSFKFPYPVSYYFARKDKFLTQSELNTALIGSLGEYITLGYGLYVDGKLVAAVRDPKEIDQALTELVAEEQSRTTEFTVELFNKTSTAQETFPTNKMTDLAHLKELLLYGSSDFTTLSRLDDIHTPTHRVCGKLGLHFAHAIGVEAYERTRKAAEEVDFSNTYYYYENEDEVPLTDVLPISFCYSKEVVTIEELPFTVQKLPDPTMYQGAEETDITGKNGRGVITTRYRYVKGSLYDQEVLSVDAFLPPVTQVDRVGSKALPEDIAPGEKNIFILPRQSTINSYYGYRDLDGDGAKDDLHNGLDIEAPMRSKIYAALSGTVEFASEFDTYGNLIRIRHDNGFVTYYAHLDEFLVKEGDRVKQGQLVGLSGNTGFTTGPHFHFELRKENGSAVNPLPYIYKEK